MPHYVAYLDLAIRSLLRLKRYDPEAAELALKKESIEKYCDRLDRVLDRLGGEGQSTRKALARLLK